MQSPSYSFFNDYSEGAHPDVFAVLSSTNMKQESGYGNDSLSVEASDLIRKACDTPHADVHFVSGGTQANLVVLGAMLRPHEAVIAASTGHINVHEAGAIEATGHRICTAPTENGKLTVDAIGKVLEGHTNEHLVKPKAVFISDATEVGTVYTKAELEALAAFCREKKLYLYIDGARIGSALCSEGSDVTLADIAKISDIFYIGGTKNGAMLGEAIVIPNKDLQTDFRYSLKQRGALLAKGRILAAQFVALFRNDLFFALAKHANAMAEKLREGISKRGFPFLVDSRTNQIFPVLPNPLIEQLKEKCGFYVWSKVDDGHSAIRLVTSWATEEAAINAFLTHLEGLTKP